MQNVFCFPATVTNLHVMDPDGKNMRRLSLSPLTEMGPCLLADGRIAYTRWEYVDKGLGNGQSLEVQTDNSTRFEDDSDSDLDDDDSFNLDELAVGTDFVEIEAYQDGTGQLIATGIERKNEVDDTRLEAPVDSFDPNVSVTLLDITYTVDAGTSYEIDDVASDASNFFATLNVNDVVKVKDVEPNGSAEELDLEN